MGGHSLCAGGGAWEWVEVYFERVDIFYGWLGIGSWVEVSFG